MRDLVKVLHLFDSQTLTYCRSVKCSVKVLLSFRIFLLWLRILKDMSEDFIGKVREMMLSTLNFFCVVDKGRTCEVTKLPC